MYIYMMKQTETQQMHTQSTHDQMYTKLVNEKKKREREIVISSTFHYRVLAELWQIL